MKNLKVVSKLIMVFFCLMTIIAGIGGALTINPSTQCLWGWPFMVSLWALFVLVYVLIRK